MDYNLNMFGDPDSLVRVDFGIYIMIVKLGYCMDDCYLVDFCISCDILHTKIRSLLSK